MHDQEDDDEEAEEVRHALDDAPRGLGRMRARGRAKTRYPAPMRVPDFIVRRFYVAGSLQSEGDGFRVQAHNGIGQGTLVGIGRISVDGEDIDLAAVTATRDGDPTIHRATDVTRQSPVGFSRGDLVTFHIAGHPLAPGRHRFEVEIHELNAGTLTLSVSDDLRAAED
jgi:hypothetical protein